MHIQPLIDPRKPLFWLDFAGHHEVCLGAFQRAASALRPLPPGALLTRRFSGGPALRLAPDTLHLLLALPSASALTDADAPRLVNRHVRPLLRALTRLGARAHFFGRDWVSAAHRPVAWAGFAHHAASGACLFEAFVGLSLPFSLPSALDGYPARAADPFLGKAPCSLADVLPAPLDPEHVARAISGAHDEAYAAPLARASWSPRDVRPVAHDARPPWAALREEVIGFIGASGEPSPELGGDLLASEDLVEAINANLAALPPRPTRPAIEAAIAEASGRTGGIIEGVRSMESLIDVIHHGWDLDPASRRDAGGA